MTKPKLPQFIFLDPKASFWKQMSELNSDDSQKSKLYGLPNLDPEKFNPENFDSDHPVIFVAKENKSLIKRKIKQLFYFLLTKDLVWQWGKACGIYYSGGIITNEIFNSAKIVEIDTPIPTRPLGKRLVNYYTFLTIAHPSLIQLFLFGIVGLLGMGVDLSTVSILVEYFNLDLRLCSLLSFPVAVTSNYHFNRQWTFKSSLPESWLKGYLKFFSVNLFGLVTRVWAIHLLMFFIPSIGQEYYLITTFFGIVTAFFVNFIMSKLFVFK